MKDYQRIARKSGHGKDQEILKAEFSPAGITALLLLCIWWREKVKEQTISSSTKATRSGYFTHLLQFLVHSQFLVKNVSGDHPVGAVPGVGLDERGDLRGLLFYYFLA